MFTNQFEEAEQLLQQAERHIQELSAEQAQALTGGVVAMRAALASLSGDIPRAISLAHQALERLPESEVLPRRGAILTTSRTYEVSGNVTATAEHEVAAIAASIRPTGSLCRLAQLYVLQGKLRQAAATYAQVVQVVPQAEVLQTIYASFSYYLA